LTARRADETSNWEVAQRLLQSPGDLPPELAKACQRVIDCSPLAVFARFPALTARRADETSNWEVAQRLLQSPGDLPPELAKACRSLIILLSGGFRSALESHAVGAETLFDVAQRLKDVEGFAKYWAWAEANQAASRAAPSPEKVALRNERAAQQASFVAESEANDDWTGVYGRGMKWHAQAGGDRVGCGTWSTRRMAALAHDYGCRLMGLEVELNLPSIVEYPADIKAFVDASIARHDERRAAAHGPLPPLPKVCRLAKKNKCCSKVAGVRPDFERFGNGHPKLACVLCCEFVRKQKDDEKKASERARAQASGNAPAKQNKAPVKKATVKKKAPRKATKAQAAPKVEPAEAAITFSSRGRKHKPNPIKDA